MPKDKFIHLIIGLSIYEISGYILTGLFNKNWLFFLGLPIAILAGILKEYIWDKKLKKGIFEIADILFTTYGGIIGAILTLLSIIIKNI